MTFCTPIEHRKARKTHVCTWCAEPILSGEQYERWASVDEYFYTNKMHPECRQACVDEADGEYIPFDNERPKP